jgi:hypothetical protein
MTTRWVLVTLAGASAIATTATSTAYACTTTDWSAKVSSLQASTLDHTTPLNPDVYRAYLDKRLDGLEAAADVIAAKVAAVPSDTVLRGRARDTAKAWLAKVTWLNARLDAVPDSGTLAATAAENAQIENIQDDLTAIAAKIKALLANAPAVVKPTTVKPIAEVRRISLRDRFRRDFRWDGTRWWGDGHHCDGSRDNAI